MSGGAAEGRVTAGSSSAAPGPSVLFSEGESDRQGIEIQSYEEFLRRKMPLPDSFGFPCEPSEVNPYLKPHQRDIVAWAARGGRRGIFTAFGLGKTLIQLETVRLALEKAFSQTGRNERLRGLIVMPLGVRQEFMRDAAKIGTEVTFIRRTEEAGPYGIYLTNYESVREGKVDPASFTATSLDEAGILRSFGSKTFSQLLFELGKAPYRFVATATPSPNDFIELLAYAHYLDVMDIGEAKTRFFRRNSEKADALTLHPHKEAEFWHWVASWSVFVQRPSDLGHSDEGYELPPLDIRWHEIPSDHSEAGAERSGQRRLLANASIGVVEASREKRRSLAGRIEKLYEIRAEDPKAHRIIWHDLEDERRALEEAIQGIVTVYGSQDLDKREDFISAFADGAIRELAAKPVMLGSGVNFQRYCSWAIFLGIGFKFNDFIQAIHRLHRFLQPNPVRIDLIYTEAEREVRRQLERKWKQHEELVANMTAIIREYGLSRSAMHGLQRALGVERQETFGASWKLVNNDAVYETRAMEESSVDLVLTSIPFSTQYEYTASYNDFGHTDDEQHFFAQMDFLSPELLRVLKPGRNLVIHVKDRVTPGAMTGLGFQTVAPFHADCIYHFRRHGFAYLGMKTIVTDVVRENNQTYRLGWTEQCKDGSRMGVGMPEYLLLFRKPPTDASNGYADDPVVKDKAEYSRGRWQFDAHGLARSNGDRLLTPEELRTAPMHRIFKAYREHSLSNPYDHEHDVSLAEFMENPANGRRLPTDFMLFQPQSWHPDVWTDVTRMRTLNGAQKSKGKEMHLCPLQFDICDRVIAQMSQPGELVYDPFSGLGTVPLRAVKLGRHGLGVELNPVYHADAAYWLRRADQEAAMPSLFDLLADGVESAPGAPA
jgi:DNA modification methylase